MDQVQQRHAPTGVTLGQRHHQPQVRFQQVTTGRLPIADHERQIAFSVLAEALPGCQQMLGVQPSLDALGQLDFIRRR